MREGSVVAGERARHTRGGPASAGLPRQWEVVMAQKGNHTRCLALAWPGGAELY